MNQFFSREWRGEPGCGAGHPASQILVRSPHPSHAHHKLHFCPVLLLQTRQTEKKKVTQEQLQSLLMSGTVLMGQEHPTGVTESQPLPRWVALTWSQRAHKDLQGEDSIHCTSLSDIYFIFLWAWDVRVDSRQFVSQQMYSDRSGEQAKMPPLRGIRSLKCHRSILGSQLEIPATVSCSLC